MSGSFIKEERRPPAALPRAPIGVAGLVVGGCGCNRIASIPRLLAGWAATDVDGDGAFETAYRAPSGSSDDAGADDGAGGRTGADDGATADGVAGADDGTAAEGISGTAVCIYCELVELTSGSSDIGHAMSDGTCMLEGESSSTIGSAPKISTN
jgi:hypothetical protein